MGDKGCAESSGRGAGGSGQGSFVEVARSSCFPNAFLGVCGLRAARWQLWVLTARTWMRARRSGCQSLRAEPQGRVWGAPKGAWKGGAAAAEDEAEEGRHSGGR